MSEQALGYDYFRPRIKRGFRLAQGGIDACELNHLHLAVGALLHGDLGHGV